MMVFFSFIFCYFLTSFISSQYLACSVFILNLPVEYAVSMSRLHCEYVCIYIHVYINVTVHAILYYVLSYRYFYCTFVLLSQQWLNKDAQSIHHRLIRYMLRILVNAVLILKALFNMFTFQCLLACNWSWCQNASWRHLLNKLPYNNVQITNF